MLKSDNAVTHGSANVRVLIDGAVKSTTAQTTGAELHRLAGNPKSLKGKHGEVPNDPHHLVTVEHDEEFTSKHEVKKADLPSEGNAPNAPDNRMPEQPAAPPSEHEHPGKAPHKPATADARHENAVLGEHEPASKSVPTKSTSKK